MEDWTFVPGFPKYGVNSLGEIRHVRTENIVTPQVNQFGVPYVCLMRDWTQLKRSLALIVARTFLPETTHAFDTPINLTGDKLDCRADNLMWRPRWFALQYTRQFRDPYERPINGPIREIEEEYVHEDSLDVSTSYGLLERDVVLSIENFTYTWPTYQKFELA